jgi:hypothetical protein
MRKNTFVNSMHTAFALLILSVVVPNMIPLARAGEGGGSHYGPGFYGDFGVAVASDPGFYLRHDLYSYEADGGGDRFTQFGQIRADLRVDVFMYMLTGLQVTDKEVLGGRYAFGASLPVVYTDISADVTLGPITSSIDDDRTAIGDPGFIPASIFWNFGNLHINAYETITAPIGSYDANRNVDSGLNYWSFDTTVAATYLHPEKGYEISAAFGHIYNTENDDTNYQTGQEFHMDYMLNQFFSETFALGLHGFYYKQITGDSGSGAILGSFKGEAAGIGPAIMWTPQIKDKDVVISAKWIHEFDTEHRLEGDHLFLNFTMAF